jgi:transposase
VEDDSTAALADEGWSNGEIAEAFDISDQTIRNARQRYETGGVEAVLTDKRQTRRRQALTDEQAAYLIAITCSQVPDGHDHWTVRMLAGQAVELDMCGASRQKPCANCSKKHVEAMAA